MSVSDIEEEIREIYEIELSASAISIITNKVNQAAQEWQNRLLDTVYLCVGLKRNSLKEVLGMWIGKSTNRIENLNGKIRWEENGISLTYGDWEEIDATDS